MQTIWLDAVEFSQKGGWKTETQFVREMGQGYLIASDIPGEPVKDAETDFCVEEDGWYRVFVRTKNWKLPEAPGKFRLLCDGEEFGKVCEEMPIPYWYFETAGEVYLKKGQHRLSVRDLTGWNSRFASVVITSDPDWLPSPELSRMRMQRARAKGLDPAVQNGGKYDVVVVGAGPGGVPAAIAAARHGLKTALFCARPFVGGNASDEGTIGLDGAGSRHLFWQETGIANEIKRYHEEKGLTWQQAMYELIRREPLLTVFENAMVTDAQTEHNRIVSVTVTHTLTMQRTRYTGEFFADCSGDGWLGYYAGAAMRLGRESRRQYGEDFAPEQPDDITMSGCICGKKDGQKVRSFLAEDTGKPVEFVTPDWAIPFPKGDALCRKPGGLREADWWMENSGDYDDLWDSEFCRDSMVRLAVGYFGWMKNEWSEKEKTKNLRMVAIALHNSKRENRRLIGDYVLCQNDYVEGKTFPDAVTYTGWSIDVHHPKGIFSGAEGPFHSNQNIPLSEVPFRCLYSKNIENLLMASRCASFTHIGLGTTRVESTLATCGQAVGTAAALCKKYAVSPRGIYESHMEELQQILLRDDMTIPGIENRDEADLARKATVTADSVNPEYWLTPFCGAQDAYFPIETETAVATRNPENAEFFAVDFKNLGSGEEKIALELFVSDSSLAPGSRPRPDQTAEITLPAGFEGVVRLPFTPKKEAACYTLVCPPAPNIGWRGVSSPFYRWINRFRLFRRETEGYEEIRISADCMGRSFFLNTDMARPVACAPSLVINGKNRSTENEGNAWVSNPTDCLPQNLELRLDEPREIRQVQVTVDTDLCYPLYCFHSHPYYRETVSDLSVSVYSGGVWKTVGRVSGNFTRQIRLNFAPVKAEAVRVTVEKTLGVNYAKIYEVRIYESGEFKCLKIQNG